MSESERRRKYRHDRVLIETARVLSSTFDDAIVYLTGVQLEMLRNVTQYLRRLETYATEYNPGYYLTPTPGDYDDILAIVSELEEVLMGNPNTIWGYDDSIAEAWSTTKSGAGDLTRIVVTVPAGYLYVLQTVQTRNTDTVVLHQHVLYRSPQEYEIEVFDAHPVGEYAIAKKLPYVLKAGDQYRVRFYDCADGDALQVRYWGYQMRVPE